MLIEKLTFAAAVFPLHSVELPLRRKTLGRCSTCSSRKGSLRTRRRRKCAPIW